jgi:NADP-dependent 3-hydroxy acid dehydrogenase YdfG
VTSLAGSRALVTGASRGIGLAVADRLLEAGAGVVRLARSLTASAAGRRLDIPCDLTVDAQVEEAVARVLATGPAPDIVVNNAGGFVLKPLVATAAQEFRGQLALNLTAPFLVLHALLPHLIARGTGHIVTLGSVADHAAFAGNAAYGASKHGLRALHEVLALELAGTGIRTTLISPGATDTALWDPVDPDRRPDLPNRSEMLRPGDVADAVLYAVTRPARVNVEMIRLMATK